jgi:hypothetical protein
MQMRTNSRARREHSLQAVRQRCWMRFFLPKTARRFTELASDTELQNVASLKAHGGCGFEEVERSDDGQDRSRNHGLQQPHRRARESERCVSRLFCGCAGNEPLSGKR